MSLFLLFLFLLRTVVGEVICEDQFPLKESISTIKQLVAKYAILMNQTDPDGTVWDNLLIEKRDRYQLDDVEYFINDNNLPLEHTFYFEQLQLLPTPVYIVPRDMVPTWNTVYPDKAYSLSKISIICQPNHRACGLRCCSRDNYVIQKKFLQNSQSATDGKLTANDEIVFGDIKYSLRNENMTDNCEYHLTYHDEIMRTININEFPTIYFSCPPLHECCGLSCQMSNSALVLGAKNRIGLPEFWTIKRINIVLTIGSVLGIVIFILVTAYNYRRSRRKPMPKPVTEFRISQQTQTSKLSLAENRQLIEIA